MFQPYEGYLCERLTIQRIKVTYSFRVHLVGFGTHFNYITHSISRTVYRDTHYYSGT